MRGRGRRFRLWLWLNFCRWIFRLHFRFFGFAEFFRLIVAEFQHRLTGDLLLVFRLFPAAALLGFRFAHRLSWKASETGKPNSARLFFHVVEIFARQRAIVNSFLSSEASIIIRTAD